MGENQPLEKMTVKDLREMAKDIPGLAGIHAMKKDELLEAIRGAQGDTGKAPATADKPVKVADPAPKKSPKAKKKAVSVKDLTQIQIKKLIVELRQEKAAAKEAKDNKLAKIIRRRIHLLKKKTKNKPAAAV
ncbi:MAG: Rho termination factor N-terminal domain-containing protein [Proteobacteria bacterium]|nr:Rho termination factor N-terminal domain-containing protein [Pseudomonadota bacterium]MBU1709311.1 Rho termination factor N-terminal domain-containing protein [Pseudomonadota bacterium]